MAEAAEKRGIGKRLKVLLALLVIAAIMFVAYCWMAFGPTGYGKIEAKQAEAIKKIDEVIKPTEATAGKPQPPLRAIPMDRNIGWSTEQPFAWPNLLTRYELATRHHISGGSLIEIMHGNLSKIGRNFVNRPSNVSAFSYSVYDGQTTAAREKLTVWVEDRLLNGPCDIRIIPDLSSAHPDRPREYARFDRISEAGTVCRAAVDAVRRACKQNQPEKAAVLLEKYAELSRQLHLARFPDDNNVLAPLQQLLLELGRNKEFPAAGFDRIRPILEKMHLNDEQLDTIKSAYIAETGGKQLDALRAMQVQMRNNEQVALPPVGPPPAQNAKPEEIERYIAAHRYEKHFNTNDYHFFLDGKVEGIGFKFFRPLLIKTYEEGLVAVYNGDVEKMLESQRRMIMYCKWMNLKPEMAPKLVDNSLFNPRGLRHWDVNDEARFRKVFGGFADQWAKATREKRFNDDADFTRLILAYVQFKRANNRAPKSVAELIPKYLDASFNKGATRYEIAITEPYRTFKWPRYKDHKEAQNDPFQQVVMRVAADQFTPYFDYETVLAEAKTDEEKQAVERMKGGMVSAVVLVQMRPATITWDKWKHDHGLDYNEDDIKKFTKPEDIKSLKRFESESFAKVFGGRNEAEALEIETIIEPVGN